MFDLNDIQRNNDLNETGGTTSVPPLLSAYVDGSYDKETARFAYGCILLDGDTTVAMMSAADDDPELATMHNVAGEIKGAEAAIRFCLEHGVRELTIFHDYEGIAKWPLGLWKANKEGTKAYRDFYKEAVKTLKITFVKVKGHSGNKYNDIADKLAGAALE